MTFKIGDEVIIKTGHFKGSFGRVVSYNNTPSYYGVSIDHAPSVGALDYHENELTKPVLHNGPLITNPVPLPSLTKSQFFPNGTEIIVTKKGMYNGETGKILSYDSVDEIYAVQLDTLIVPIGLYESEIADKTTAGITNQSPTNWGVGIDASVNGITASGGAGGSGISSLPKNYIDDLNAELLRLYTGSRTIKIRDDVKPKEQPTIKCECGTSAVGGSRHSSWCPLYDG